MVRDSDLVIKEDYLKIIYVAYRIMAPSWSYVTLMVGLMHRVLNRMYCGGFIDRCHM